MFNVHQTFDLTMSGFERAFQARHIATFGLITCNPDDVAANVLHQHPAFDQIPVADQGRVVGVLEQRGEAVSGLVCEHLRPLDESLLVAADEPLSKTMPLLREACSYRLVLEGTRINGVVTRSDLLKLPVRLYAFSLVTHLELIMAEIIQQHRPENSWLALLSESRRSNVEDKRLKLASRRADPDLLELTDFCDKRDIVRKILHPGDGFDTQLKGVEEVRNAVAHAGSYATSNSELQEFLDRLEYARTWINRLPELSSKHQS